MGTCATTAANCMSHFFNNGFFSSFFFHCNLLKCCFIFKRLITSNSPENLNLKTHDSSEGILVARHYTVAGTSSCIHIIVIHVDGVGRLIQILIIPIPALVSIPAWWNGCFGMLPV